LNRPRRVLHLITRLIVGGAQENTILTASGLNSGLAGGGRYSAEIVSGVQTGPEGSLMDEARERGIPLTLMPCLVREINPCMDILALLRLRRLMTTPDGAPAYDIVHTHSSKAGILGRMAARLARVPVIVHTVHGWSFHDQMPLPARMIYIALERRTAGFTRKLVVVTSRDAEKGLRNGIGRPEQYVLIRSGIELERFMPNPDARNIIRRELGIPCNAPVVGSVTRLSPQKAPLDLVEMFAIVARQNPDARLLIVGDGPLRRQVEDRIAALDISSRIVLTGLRRDVPALMAAMDVFVLTSLWEGLPRVIPQAMACGLPVIATDADGSAEAVRDGQTGFVTRRGDIRAQAARTLELLDQPCLRIEMGEKARAAAQEYDAAKMVKEIAALYDSLCCPGQWQNPG